MLNRFWAVRSVWPLALLAGVCAAQDRLVVSTCENPAEWTGGTRDTEHVKEGRAAIGWTQANSPALALEKVPGDWSGYDHLSFWLWSAKATGSRIAVSIGSADPQNAAAASGAVALDFSGWKRVRLYLPDLRPGRGAAGWNHVGNLRFTAAEPANGPGRDAVIAVDELVLTREGPDVGPKTTDDDLLAELDLTWPGLEPVAAALARGDRSAAKSALANYYRHRTRPRYYISMGEKANPKPAAPDTARAERALRHEFVSIGYPHTFGPAIDWHYDVTAAPGSKYAPNNEWTWQLNRHAEWLALSRAYRDTWDEKYAREFVAQMTAWARDCPMPDDSGNRSRSAWRTIETGIRASAVWPELWYRFAPSPSMTDDALLTFLKAYIDHARHLMRYHTPAGNWLAMEASGLFHAGVLFPEFRAVRTWREIAGNWTYAELENQVLPDGVQIELSSSYHHVSLRNFLAVYKIARLNDTPLPGDFLKRLEKMYDFDVYGAMPNRSLPPVQDGGVFDVRPALEEAAGLFPERRDFQWYASNGKTGRPPAGTSHDFPYAGYYVMRSGWESDARWLWFDGGPFGYGHQHEDKLALIVAAYGKTFLVDPGNFTYERSKWRSYFIDSPSHNVVLVDGQPQRRRGQPRQNYLIKEPLPHVWVSEPAYDYAEATFDEGFGGDVKRSVSHTRAVLFIKPDFWVVLDALAPKNGQEHAYDALFHFDTKLKAEGLRVVTRNADEANLTIAARPDPGLSLKIVEGQEDPLQGWLPGTGIRSREAPANVHPAPVGVYSLRGGAKHLLYVLAPAPKGSPDPVSSVEPLVGDPAAARITFTDGHVYEVRFRLGRPAEWKRTR